MSPARSAASKKKAPKKKATKSKAPKKKAAPAAKKVSKAKVTKKPDAKPNPTVAMCKELAAIVEAHSLSELTLDTERMTLTLRRGEVHGGMPVMATHAAPAILPAAVALTAPAESAPSPEVDDSLHEVTSPFVGTFYRSPNPDSPPYCEVGQRVEKGQVLCIVEAMKLMNEIEADIAGTVESIMVENSEVVEYGKPLFKIKP